MELFTSQKRVALMNDQMCYGLKFYLWFSFVFVSSWSAGQGTEAALKPVLDKNASLYVLTFLDPECPISQKYTHTLNRMAEQFRQKDVQFYGIISVQNIANHTVERFTSYYEIDFKCVPDPALRLARSLDAGVTPEAFLLDSNMNILYSGAIDNWYYDLGRARRKPSRFFLKDAIVRALEKEPIAQTRAEPVGCAISYTKLLEH